MYIVTIWEYHELSARRRICKLGVISNTHVTVEVPIPEAMRDAASI